jgi:Ca2+-binding RTX toxin-like protein
VAALGVDVAVPANIDLSSLDGTTGFKLNGEPAARSGVRSVASAGDVNGDGFADVIVGAPYADANGVNSGASYVVFGKAAGFATELDLSTLDGTAGFRLDGVAAGDGSGWSVASAGDINGDGYDDLVIGVPFSGPNGSAFFGASYVVFGKAAGFEANLDLSTLNGTTGFRMPGEYISLTGHSVASAGDVNGDGFDDLIIGVPLAITNGYTGASYVVFGKASGFAADIDLSTLNGTTGFRLNGDWQFDRSGRSVASAGDVNGDGFDDLIVGSNGEGYSSSYVVFGKASGFAASLDISTLDGTNGFRLAGTRESVVASAGDVNGDGFDDLIIGGTSVITYVLFGKASGFAASISLASVDGMTGFWLAGRGRTSSVASAGDFNGDGYDDLIVAAGYGNASYVVFGKAAGFTVNINLSSLDGTAGLRLGGIDSNNGYIGSVASAGDVNGDGFDDLIIGDRNTGLSYVVFGGAFGASDAPVTTTGTAAAEVLMGGIGNDVLTGGGGGDVFHGGAGDDRLVVADLAFRLADGGNGTDTLALSGTGLVLDLTGHLAATKVESIERIDLTGSGGNTLKIDQAAFLRGIGTFTGGQHVLTVEGNAGDIVSLQDFNWIRIGSFADASGTFDRYVRGDAEVRVEQGVAVGGPASASLSVLDGSNGFTLNGLAAEDRTGNSVASAGDLNGDGFDDLIIGAVYANANGLRSGASYVVFGKASGFDANVDLASLNGANGFKLSGAAMSDRSGFSVASAGDVNGDGYDDLIVGAYAASPNGPRSGASYVVFGKAAGFGANLDLSSLDGSGGFKLSGGATRDFAGWSVASAGDLNGDGFDDLVVGAWGADANGVNAGASYVVFGKAAGFAANLDLATLNGTNGFKLKGAGAGDYAGKSVASAGDFNGDGFDDLVIGAWGVDANGVNAGAGYVVFGKAGGFAAEINLGSLNGSNGFRLAGAAAGDQTGTTIASAGDINGDGFADVIVGSTLAGVGAGASYVVFGKASGFAATLDLASLNGTNGFRLDGPDFFAYSGSVVASAGDFNGDGFDDLIVGASGPGAYAGATYVVFGKASGFAATFNLGNLDGISGFRLDGVASMDSTGFSAASAGDVNGDGYDDLIIGGQGVDTNGNSSGAAYVVFGAAFSGAVTTTGTAAAEILMGGSGDDVLTGGGGSDVYHAGAGDDRIVVAGTNFRLVDGGTGSDTLVLAGAGLTLDLANPLVAARLQGIERVDLTGSGNNTLKIGSAAVLGGIGEIVGGKHILTVLGDDGDKVMFADPQWTNTGTFSNPDGTFDRYELGNAIVDIEQGVVLSGVTINGNAGNNTISPTKTVAGQPFATDRDDVLNGGAGNDVLDGGVGGDIMTGGTGNDTYYVDDEGDEVVELPGGGTDTVKTTLSVYTLGADVERLEFIGIGSFIGTGSDFANNTLRGGAGNDALYDDLGNDTLDGGAGADYMLGGIGNDTYYVDDEGDVVFEVMGAGTDTVRTTLSDYTLADNVERLEFIGTGGFTGHGNDLANVLTGGTGNDTLDGGVGNDLLIGGAGADLMTGGAGNDTYNVDNVDDVVVEAVGGGTDTVKTTLSSYTLGDNVENLRFVGTGDFSGHGNARANALTGGAGNDTLIGGKGADSLTGGAGADVFVFREASDSLRGARDVLTDFTVGEDSLDFTQMNTGGNFHALQTVTSAPATIGAHSLVAFVSGGNTVLYANDTGAAQTTSHASMEILLKGVTMLGDADLGYILI